MLRKISKTFLIIRNQGLVFSESFKNILLPNLNLRIKQNVTTIFILKKVLKKFCEMTIV